MTVPMDGGHGARAPLPTLRSDLKPNRQLLRAVHKIGLRHLDLAVERDRLQSRQQFFEQDTHFQLRQILPEAEMRAVAERDVAVRLAGEIEIFSNDWWGRPMDEVLQTCIERHRSVV